jgi:hypothetical protein
MSIFEVAALLIAAAGVGINGGIFYRLGRIEARLDHGDGRFTKIEADVIELREVKP